jgi:hypothetical protein
MLTRILDWLFPTQRLVSHLESEVAWWRAQWAQARAREQAATDQLLAFRLGAAPLTPPPPPADTFDVVRELMQNEEFARAGDA